MNVELRQIEQAKEELARIRAELGQLEKHMDRLHESVKKALVELFGSDRQIFLDWTRHHSQRRSGKLCCLEFRPFRPTPVLTSITFGNERLRNTWYQGERVAGMENSSLE